MATSVKPAKRKSGGRGPKKLKKPKEQTDEAPLAENAFGDVLSSILKSEDVVKSEFLEDKQKVIDELAEKETKESERKLLLDKNHIVTNDTQLEAALLRIARKGVVRLFNAVSSQQHNINPEELRDKNPIAAEKMSKESFFDMLKKSTDANKNSADAAKSTTKQGGNKAPNWSVLKDDYLMQTNFKDWDKEQAAGGGDDAQFSYNYEDSDEDDEAVDE